jgi:Protein of unknown function, DUF547
MPFTSPLSRERRLVLLDVLRHAPEYGGLGRAAGKALTTGVVADWLLARRHAHSAAAAVALADELGLGGPSAQCGVALASGAGAKEAVLNGFTGGEVRPLEDVLRDVADAFREVCEVVLRRNGHEVLYGEIAGLEAWGRYLVAVEDLAVSSGGEMPDAVRKAGFFNVYNAMIVHAKLVYGHPKSLALRGKFFTSASYTVCGVRLMSGDLEHKVLRRKAADGSELARFRLHEKDPRMHFVLNCGARSCPPIRPISMDDPETDIAANTTYFIGQNVTFKGRKVMVSRLWKWFRNDFTPGTTRNAALLAWISAHGDESVRAQILQLLSATQIDLVMDADGAPDPSGGVAGGASSVHGKVKVKFCKYDWADNGDWNAPSDTEFMPLYDASFALKK